MRTSSFPSWLPGPIIKALKAHVRERTTVVFRHMDHVGRQISIHRYKHLPNEDSLSIKATGWSEISRNDDVGGLGHDVMEGRAVHEIAVQIVNIARGREKFPRYSDQQRAEARSILAVLVAQYGEVELIRSR